MTAKKTSRRPAIAPEGQSVTFIELFFDLVFVFAITQVTAQVAHHLDFVGVLQGILVFWMIWWGWTQFTWALNPADTNHGLVRFGTLVATATAFPMALGVGGAFGESGLFFIIPYVLIRAIGLMLYMWVTSEHAEQQRAVRIFGGLSLLGIASAIAGGFAAPELRAWFWLGAVVLDFVAAGIAGDRGTWNLHIPHFAERHGLIVIIALGESLIVAGNGAVSQELTPALFNIAIGAVVLTCILWWTYFGWLKDALEHAFEAQTSDLGSFGRDVYSFGHFPMVAGIIALAVSIEEMVAHPNDPLHTEVTIMFVAGITLFVGAAAMNQWRANKEFLITRFVCLAALAGVAFFLNHGAILWLLIAGIVALLVITLIEARFHREEKVMA